MNDKSKNLKKPIAIITSVYSVILGALFIFAAAHLFFTGGTTPYTMERCGEYLKTLAIPSLIYALLVIVGFVIPKDEDKKAQHRFTRSELLTIFRKRVDEARLTGESAERLRAFRTRKAIIVIISYTLSAILLAFAFFFIITYDFTAENLNGDVIKTLSIALPVSLVALLLHYPFEFFIERICEDEYALLKEKRDEIAIETKNQTVSSPEKNTAIITAVVLAVGVVFIILGVFNGGIGDVFGKAVKICTECIGLG